MKWLCLAIASAVIAVVNSLFGVYTFDHQSLVVISSGTSGVSSTTGSTGGSTRTNPIQNAPNIHGKAYDQGSVPSQLHVTPQPAKEATPSRYPNPNYQSEGLAPHSIHQNTYGQGSSLYVPNDAPKSTPSSQLSPQSRVAKPQESKYIPPHPGAAKSYPPNPYYKQESSYQKVAPLPSPQVPSRPNVPVGSEGMSSGMTKEYPQRGYQPPRSYLPGGSLETQGVERNSQNRPQESSRMQSAGSQNTGSESSGVPDQVHQMYHQKAYPFESEKGPTYQQQRGEHFYHPGGTKVPRFARPQSMFHPGTHQAHPAGRRPYVQEDQYRAIPNSGLWHRPPVQGESEIFEQRYLAPSDRFDQLGTPGHGTSDPSELNHSNDPPIYIEPTPPPLEYHHRQLPKGAYGSASKTHPHVHNPRGVHRYTHTDRTHSDDTVPYYPGMGPPLYAQKPDSTGKYYPHTTRRAGDLFYGQEDYASEYGSARLKNEAMAKNIRNDLNHPGVTVSVHDGAVVLTGIANSNTEKYEVERQVRSMAGVTSVRNELRIPYPAGQK